MSKKPQKNQVNPKKPQIVDQQNQPFLRTISKRVRNINKKLLEITDLKKKDDLKPEQIEKVNRKTEYEQQRSRLEDIANFFRQVYAQNAEHYKNNQLQELDGLANAVAVLRGNSNFKEADKLTELNRALTEKSTLSVTESAKNISEVLRRFATDYKLKKSLGAFVGENQVPQQQQQKPEQAVQQPVQEVKAQEPKRQAPVVVQQPVEPVLQKVQQQVPIPAQKVEQPVVATVQVVKAVQAAQNKQAEQKPAQDEQHKRGGNRPRGDRNRNRGPRQNRPQGQEGGYKKEGGDRKRYYDNQERRQKPNYKPKEGANQAYRQERQSDSDSSLEKQASMRNFKKDQIKKLQNDGFTVVGKPKPKAKQGQKEWHDHTHGRKAHHHHSNQAN